MVRKRKVDGRTQPETSGDAHAEEPVVGDAGEDADVSGPAAPAAPAPDPVAPLPPGEAADREVVAEQVDDPVVAELAETKDRYLRLAAEFDNFRKRRARESLEERARAQGDLLRGVLDALDDLARVSDVDPAQAEVAEVISGVELVERKLLRQLALAGLQRIGAVGDPFDPNLHEAVASVPASGAADDHTVAAVLQAGYTFNQQLLRPARVQVRLWSGDGGGA